jgi:heme-degrading monooxygenase HmoA
MIAILTHHWVKEDKLAEAKVMMDRNAAAQKNAPGFGSRQTLYSQSEPTKVTTLGTWDSNEDYDAWRASPARAAASGSGSEELWARPNESERFHVAD